MAKAPSSYIATTSAAKTRTADVLSAPFPARPQALTIYLRFIEQGAVTMGGSPLLITIGAAPTYITIYGTGTYYNALFSTPVALNSTLTVAPTIGQLVELCLQISATGTIQLHQSINGGAVSSSTASAAGTIPQAFTVATLSLVGIGGAQMPIVPLRDVLIVRGVHTLETMRVRAGIN